MSRLYGSVRPLINTASFCRKEIAVSAGVNFQFRTNRNIQSYSLVYPCKLEKRDRFVVTVRSFAKDKGKLKKGVPRIPINDQELSEVFDIEKLYSDFQIQVDHLKKIYLEQLNLRTNVKSIQDIKVRYDGNVHTIQDLAEIKRKGSNDIVLDMSCFVDAIPSVLESLRNSPLNVNPNQEGSAIIVPVPRITREFRESLAKKAKVFFNECKENIRKVQNKKIKEVTQKETLSEDFIFGLKAQLTAIGEKHITEAEEIYKAKEKELLATE